MSDNYHNNLLQQDSVNDIISLLEVIDTENSDIDHVLSKVNDIYIKAASTQWFKKKGYRPSNKPKKVKPNNPWMSYDCLKMRQEIRSLGKRLQKDPTNTFLRHTYSIHVKQYNRA